ncbi:hypothetical protein Bca52824_018151 [Brassica carinata]|uniref:F-box domain-containing protein n=1 Tax=Brassica carinata TaxID=52824 RepID=A0A8X7VNY2_BRACI|nr:hypothetical protein Bca52824_018151 [Brassica carinata]
MEWLHQDVVKLILERLPVKSLLRFKSVSKQWKSTIESRSFQERQWKKQRQESGGDPDVLMVSASTDESLRTLVLGSSSSVKIPTPRIRRRQQHKSYFKTDHGLFKLGFGKEIIVGTTYKPVWLYNSSEIGLDNATTCEVLTLSPMLGGMLLLCSLSDGSLHWFTDCEETKICSFDLHTEAFQVISKAPFAANSHPYAIVLCNLDNRLCVSQMNLYNQVIWSFNSGNKTWHKIFSIDLVMTCILYDCPTLCAFRPLALLDGKKKNLLFYDSVKSQYLLIHDPETDPDHFTFTAEYMGFVVCYIQSLISI